MELYRQVLQIPVPDNSVFRRPQWLPVELFVIEDCEIPLGWCFRAFVLSCLRAYGRGTTAYERGFRARWGYRQLVESDEHRDGLEERDPVALVIFGEQLDQLEGRPDGSNGLMSHPFRRIRANRLPAVRASARIVLHDEQPAAEKKTFVVGWGWPPGLAALFLWACLFRRRPGDYRRNLRRGL